MDIITHEGDAYVKLEVVFPPDNYGVPVRFNVALFNITANEALDYAVWDAELCPEVNRKPQLEAELLSSILDHLLVDRYIDLDNGLLEGIGIHPTRIYISLNERRSDFVQKKAETQQEIKELIEKSVADFIALKT